MKDDNYVTYESDIADYNDKNNKRKRKIAIAAIIILGLSGGALVLDEATKEEIPVVPRGWLYNNVTRKLVRTVTDTQKAELISIKNPDTGKTETVYSAPSGYVLVGDRAMKTVTELAIPSFDNKGIVERTIDQLVDSAEDYLVMIKH